MKDDISTLEQKTGELFGDLWAPYDQELFDKSVDLFCQRLDLAGFDRQWFAGKNCLDAGCGGGRNTLAMASLGAASVIGADLGEEGLIDAQRRAKGIATVEFQLASVLNMPYHDEQFDMVWCAGVLMHTADEERVMDELARVVKPGGKLYLLVYATGGMRWPLMKLLRPLATQIGIETVTGALKKAETPANKRRTFLDDLFCPTFDFFHWRRLNRMLQARGFVDIDRWGTAPRLDHEASLSSYRIDLCALLSIFESGSSDEFGANSALFEQGRRIIQATVDTIRWFEDTVANQQMPMDSAMETVIGQGHHRVLATKA